MSHGTLPKTSEERPKLGRSKTEPVYYKSTRSRSATKNQLNVLQETLQKMEETNVALKQRFYENVSKKISETGGTHSQFPDTQSFKQEYRYFINNTHRPLLHALMKILEEILENEDDDEDADVDNKAIKVKQIAYKILYNIMMECFAVMRQRKNRFYAIICELLHAPNNEASCGMISVFVGNHFQDKHHTFVENKYYDFPSKSRRSFSLNRLNQEEETKNKKNLDGFLEVKSEEEFIQFNHKNIDDDIVNIYDRMKEVKFESSAYHASYTYNVLFMLLNARKSIHENDVHHFIAQCCVLFWVMLLYKQPTLQFSHHSFWIKEKHSSSIQYCGIPGIVIKNGNCKLEALVAPHILKASTPKAN